jgi:hypothetical protein
MVVVVMMVRGRESGNVGGTLVVMVVVVVGW